MFPFGSSLSQKSTECLMSVTGTLTGKRLVSWTSTFHLIALESLEY